MRKNENTEKKTLSNNWSKKLVYFLFTWLVAPHDCRLPDLFHLWFYANKQMERAHSTTWTLLVILHHESCLVTSGTQLAHCSNIRGLMVSYPVLLQFPWEQSVSDGDTVSQFTQSLVWKDLKDTDEQSRSEEYKVHEEHINAPCAQR